MRYLILISIFCCVCQAVNAQSNPGVDTSLKFNQRYTKCERKWVVMSKADTAKSYSFGFIYIDSQAGFTFDLKGVFKVGDKGKYILDTNIFKNTGSIKYRIAPNWRRVALLSPQHYDELGIKAQPDWIKYYYNYTDTVAHDHRWGYIYNDVDEPTIALSYLEPAYRMKPHADGVEFEMAYAYNVLNRFDDAIKTLEPAILNNPNNSFFYKELGYAYSAKKDYEKAIDAYKRGLEHAADEKSDSKGELAFNMANAYKAMGNMDEYKNWMIKAKSYTPTNSQYYKRITDAGF